MEARQSMQAESDQDQMEDVRIHAREGCDLLEDQLRVACETLMRLPASHGSSIKVLERLVDFPPEAWRVIDLADGLAKSCQLGLEAEVNGPYYQVRFYRSDGADAETRGD